MVLDRIENMRRLDGANINMSLVFASGEVWPYTFDPEETNDLNAEVTSWLFANPDAEIAAYAPPDPVDPLTLPVTKRQAVLAMVQGAGVEDPDAAVEAAIAAISDATTRGLARADWRYAPQFWRDHALFNDADLMAAMGLTASDIDGLWVLALTQPG